MEGIKEYGLGSLPIGELWSAQNRIPFICETVQLRPYLLNHLTPRLYLSSIEPHISEGLISNENFLKIKSVASSFTAPLTSFFGFETKLGSSDASADYLFAISSQRGERDAFAAFLQNSNDATQLLQKPEWQRLRDFALAWADPASALYDNVLGLWLEFDYTELSKDIPIPCVFMHTIPLIIRSESEERKYDWVFDTAVPFLLGHPLSSHLHDRLLHALRHLPDGASVMDIGFMLSRLDTGVRLVFKHLPPTQILPYLKSLGWTDPTNELTDLIEELQQQVTRVVLHITLTEQGVAPKIGLECSFAPDQYHQETRWGSFFEYLQHKGVCCPEKQAELRDFPGVTQDDPSLPFDLASYNLAVLLSSDISSTAVVRYLSHVKLCYNPGQPLEAKAYPGFRLFGLVSSERDQDVC
jgi:hypothetical protein